MLWTIQSLLLLVLTGIHPCTRPQFIGSAKSDLVTSREVSKDLDQILTLDIDRDSAFNLDPFDGLITKTKEEYSFGSDGNGRQRDEK